MDTLFSVSREAHHRDSGGGGGGSGGGGGVGVGGGHHTLQAMVDRKPSVAASDGPRKQSYADRRPSGAERRPSFAPGLGMGHDHAPYISVTSLLIVLACVLTLYGAY